MAGSSSPCGACKFLRRKCVRGCVFAPYFCHEEGAAHFAAIHKVFGASNVSKLLAHLPVADRREAAVTISYEAQARIQDPIYGCVSHIFALQQQIVNLQAQLASLKEQPTHCIINSSTSAANPNLHKSYAGGRHSFSQDVQSWMQFDANFKMENLSYCVGGGAMNLHQPSARYENPGFEEEKHSFGSFDSVGLQSNHEEQGSFQDDLQSVAFRYIHHS